MNIKHTWEKIIQREESWTDVREKYENRYKRILNSTIQEQVIKRDAWGWQLHNEEEYTEEEREEAAQHLSRVLQLCLMEITSCGTIVEDHIRTITAARMSRVIHQYEPMAYGDDPLYEVVAAVIDDLYAGLQVVDGPSNTEEDECTLPR